MRLWKHLRNPSLLPQLKSQDDILPWGFAALTPLRSARDTLYIMLSQMHVCPVAFLESSSQITAFRTEPARLPAVKISSCGICWPSPFYSLHVEHWVLSHSVRWTFRMFVRWVRNSGRNGADAWLRVLAEVLVPYLTSQRVDFQNCVLANTNFWGVHGQTRAWYDCYGKVMARVIQGFLHGTFYCPFLPSAALFS